MLVYKLKRVCLWVIPAGDEKLPGDIFIGLPKSGNRTSMRPKYLCLVIIFFESVTVLDCYLGFPSAVLLAAIVMVFKCISERAGRSHPTPPIPAIAMRLCFLRACSISAITFTRPTNLGSFSNGTIKTGFSEYGISCSCTTPFALVSKFL